ncbi:ATP-binding protein [Polaromonas sp. UC242_47]|uniref:PAS domain-containing sensor histidine kinase n=1 Tax=Polaromonas sp. UC242_47 TaxID=3374626 RepID=UPI00378F7200
MERQTESVLSRSLQAALQSNVLLFESQTHQALADARTVATRPFLVQSLQTLESTPDDAAATLAMQRAATSFLPTGFDGLSFYDARGREVARAGRFSQKDERQVALSKKDNAFLLWNGKFVVQSHLQILDPKGLRVGEVMTETSLPLLTRVFSEVGAIGQTAEFALCAPLEDGGKDMDCFLGRVSGVEFKRVARIVEGKALPMNYALLGNTGIIVARDYRREQVVATYVPVASSGFGMVLKIDQQELYAPIFAQLRYILPLLAVLAIVGMLLLNFMVTPVVRQLVRSERTVRESEERFRALTALSSDWFWEQDENFRFVQVSGETPGMARFTRDKVIGMTRWELDHVNMDDSVWAAHKAQLERHEVFRDFQITLRYPDGEIRYESVSGVPIFDASGRFTGYRGTGRDDTEMRRVAEALRASEVQLREITDAVPAWITYIDADQRFRFHNRAYEEAIGLTAGQIDGKTLWEVLGEKFHETVRPQVEHALSGYPVVYERIQKTPRGGNRDFVINYFPRYGDGGEEGRVVGFYGLGTDITELKRIDRMKSEFVSTVSHELRTPLTSIRGSLGLIAGGVAGQLPEAVKTLVGIAKTNCERLIRLVNDILDIEKIESGKMKLDLQAVDLKLLLAQALVANEGFGAAHKVGLSLHAPNDKVQVHVDSDRLMQVITNLLSNAIKFSPFGGAVEVHVSLPGTKVRIEVRDHGPGIPLEFRKRIFQKFSQADSSDTRQNGGTGLGLNISQAIVERLGGSIGFQTEAGAGSTFFIELPQWKGLPAAAVPAIAHARGPTPGPHLRRRP